MSLLTLLAHGAAHAQPPQSCAVDPDEPGSWSRPYGPFAAMGLGSTTHLPSREIAHAIVLPPPSDQPDLVRVLFMCLTTCGSLYPTETHASGMHRSFVWYPKNRPGGDRPPTTVEQLAGPGAGYIGTSDGFCSGHVVTADGSVIVVGGSNKAEECISLDPCIVVDDNPVGHKWISRLDTSDDPPVWVDDETWPAQMGREHWYPTVTAMHDGTVFIGGHTGAPSYGCQVPHYPYGTGPESDTERMYQLFDPVAGVASVWENAPVVSGVCSPVPAFVPLSLGTYPRLHLLSGGWLVFTNTHGHPWGTGETGLIMDFEQPACPGSTNERRWNDVFLNGPTTHRDGGTSVHLLLRDAVASKGVRDVVYTLGGTDALNDDVPCSDPGPALPPLTSIFDSMDRLVPDTNLDGIPNDGMWTAVAPMLRKRAQLNAVLLPTGTFVVGGGIGLVNDVGAICEAVLEAEEYYPAEIFGGPAGGTWRQRSPLTRPRTYHSVAGLLPDGSAFWAGGNAEFGSGHPSVMYHTAEIFAPAYFYDGNRPVITTPLNPATDPPISYGTTWEQEIQVTLGCDTSNTVAKVVLIRSSSTTHAFDMNQRYVELRIADATGVYPDFTVTMDGPHDGYVAPPGYYLLFVIDANGLPSEGKWVRVAASQS